MVDETVIWGGGAIGGVIASQLVRAGRHVILVDIVESHVEHIQKFGLDVVSPTGTGESFSIKARTPRELSGKYSRFILCVKGQHTTSAATMICPFLHDDGWVLSMQNGLTEQRVADVLGSERTIGAHVNFAADYLEPGRIQYGGGGSILIGKFSNGRISQAKEAASLLGAAFEDCRYEQNLYGYKWSKVCLGAMLFITAMSNEPMAEQFSNRRLERLWAAVSKEVLDIALRLGVRPEAFDGFDPSLFADPTHRTRVRQGLDGIANHCRTAWIAKPHSGIWRDLYIRQRPTEVDPQITDVVFHAAKLGSDTPIIKKLIEMIREIECGKRIASPENAMELMEACHVSEFV